MKSQKNDNDTWVATIEKNDTVRIVPVKIMEDIVPDVRGMSLRDALYLLENSGLKVEFTGRGRVRRQEPEKGTVIRNGMVISLVLDV